MGGGAAVYWSENKAGHKSAYVACKKTTCLARIGEVAIDAKGEEGVINTLQKRWNRLTYDKYIKDLEHDNTALSYYIDSIINEFRSLRIGKMILENTKNNLECRFGHSDCFGCGKDGNCNILTDTHFPGRKDCPFYKKIEDISEE